jgi:rod shape-determining protein MreC
MINRPRSRSWALLFLAIIAIIALILHESGQLQPIEDLAQYVIGPVQRSINSMVGGTADLFGTFRDARELRAENQQLREENSRLITENIRLKEFEAENATLRDLLKFTRNNPSYTTLAADVIGRDPSPYLSTIMINMGENRGLKPGMPVITGGSALVGRVLQVNPRTAKVQILEDVSSAVNAMIQSSRATGLVRGQPDGTLIMELIPQEEKVQPGDIVLTSGLGGDLPRALVIGQVSEVMRRDVDLFQSAALRPAVDLNRLEVVTVVTNFEPLSTQPGQP